MHVRDAVEADAGALATVSGAPEDVMEDLVHDRTVRVAERSGTDGPIGFVSFDADAGTVHVTRIGGTEEACKRLLAEPIAFAAGESMAVETVLVPDSPAIGAVSRLGFEETGAGPRFEGESTTRYRLEAPEEVEE